MPELPEVETIRKGLIPLVENKTIKDLNILNDKFRFLSVIKNEKINSIGRLGKHLIFKLDHFYLLSHLRMEGKDFYTKESSINKHDSVVFKLDDGYNLIYNDTRKFGEFNLFNINEDIYSLKPLCNVGKEPFTITKEELYEKVHKLSKPIKTVLLDQSIISGLGNIYVDEVLFLSKLNPLKPAKDLSIDDISNIINNSIITLNKAIKLGGSTIRTYHSLGEAGKFQNELLVHMRENERCLNCNGFISKIRVNGRGTYYCPSCERLNHSKLIAITGALSSGKSKVLSIINELGFNTLSLDSIYKDLLSNNKNLNRELKKNFNTNNLSIIRNIAFSSKENNELLNNITHKYIYKEMFNEIEKIKDKYIFIEVPLLFESKLEKAFDKTISVKESDELRIELLKKRNISNSKYDEIMTYQLSRDEKARRADYVINNNSDVNSLKKETKKIVEDITHGIF